MKYRKPIKWYFFKVLCEFGWKIRNIIKTQNVYYKFLNKLCDTGFNLYGQKI